MYIDNVGVIGEDGTVVADTLDAVIETLESKGLATHERVVSCGELDVLGVVLDSGRQHTRISRKRVWRTRGALLYLASRPRASGQMVEITVGRATFAGLLRREVLSVFHTVYAFMTTHYHEQAPLWESCRAELRAFAGLLVMLVADWGPLGTR